MAPAQFKQLLESAVAHHRAGRLADADKLYRQARAAQPNQFDVLHLSGALAYQQKRYTEALDLLTRALRLNSRSAPCTMRLGLACFALTNFPSAEMHFRSALRLDPHDVDTWSGLANTLHQLGKVPEAIDAYKKVAELNPASFEAEGMIGGLLNETQGPAAAIPHFKRALAANPHYAVGWCNLGIAQLAERDWENALASLDNALKERPAFAQAEVARALVFQQTYQLDKALASFDRALTWEPDHREARSGKLLTLNYFDEVSASELFQQHWEFGRHAEPTVPSSVFTQNDQPLRRLRLGFFSPDLRTHSVVYFLEPLLRHLDPAEFEIFLYHNHVRVDAVSEKLKRLSQSWKNLVGKTNAAAEQIVRADRLDLAVDLAGHTGFNRLNLFARRIAPVQISYLGYPNTTGLTTMDYRLVDALSDPLGDESDQWYTEKRIRFSPCAWAYQAPADAPEPKRSGDPALTFGSFNNPAKLSPRTLALWARVLAANPGSRLRLKGHGLSEPAIAGVIEKKLQTAGVDLARIDLISRVPQVASHLELYERIDIALDPFPYHGTTTTCEALWMGVPVVTLAGDRHASRVGVSLLNTVGHSEWVAQNENGYVEIASKLARDAALRKTMRTQLRQEMTRSALLDHATHAKNFSAAARGAWSAFCALASDQTSRRLVL